VDTLATVSLTPSRLARIRAYDGIPKRFLRERRRRVKYVLDRTLWPQCQVADTYWWDWEPNFGDELTAWILPRLGIAVRRRDIEASRLVGIGSLLEHLPRDYTGTVWGSGLIFDTPKRLPQARILALRGHLTHANLGRPAVRALGDPGLLVAHGAPRAEASYPVALVPHIRHRKYPLFTKLITRYPDDCRLVDVMDRPGEVVGAISQAAAVISSSLHGVVVADAFDIPAAWVMPQPELTGGRYKFHDYESVVTPGRSREAALHRDPGLAGLVDSTRRADRRCVDDAKTGLLDALQELRRMLPVVRPASLLLGR
jgi:hypothetical protein